MVIWSDNIKEYLIELNKEDGFGNAGNVYYLKELSDENDTYPAGEALNLLVKSGSATAVVNGMSLDTNCPTTEIWLFGAMGQDMIDLVDALSDKYTGINSEIHVFDQEVANFLVQRGAEIYDETLEFVGQNLRLESAEDICKITEKQLEILSELEDENISLYCGQIPLDQDNCAVYGKMDKKTPITICTLEFNHNGFLSIVEPIWVYTSANYRNKGLAKSCVSHALHSVGENVVVLYHTEADNKPSIKLAKALGLTLNNKCFSLAVDL